MEQAVENIFLVNNKRKKSNKSSIKLNCSFLIYKLVTEPLIESEFKNYYIAPFRNFSNAMFTLGLLHYNFFIFSKTAI